MKFRQPHMGHWMGNKKRVSAPALKEGQDLRSDLIMKANRKYWHTTSNPGLKPAPIQQEAALGYSEKNDLDPVPALLSLRTQATLVRCATVGGVSVDTFIQTALAEVLAGEASTVGLAGRILEERGSAAATLDRALVDLAAGLRGLAAARRENDQSEAERRGASACVIQTLMACHPNLSKKITKEHIIRRFLEYSDAQADTTWPDFAAWYSQRIAKEQKHLRGVEEAVKKALNSKAQPARKGYSVKFAKGAKRKKKR